MAAPAYMRWLPAAALEKLGRLEFLAHGTVDGFIAGRHRSSRKGASVEFAEHREYFPGDDLRNLDWKLAARRQRLYVREYVDETNLRATLALDCSASMLYGSGSAAGALTKFDYARHLAAFLAYLLVRQQDGVGFAACGERVRQYLSARAQTAQLRQLLGVLDALEPAGATGFAESLHELAERIPRRGVVFVISDCFSPIDGLLNALAHLRFRRHEVVVLQVIDRAEREFPFHELINFEDLESPERLNVDAQALRREYLRRFEAHLKRLKDGCGEHRITYELLDTSVPCDQALADVLVRYHENPGI